MKFLKVLVVLVAAVGVVFLVRQLPPAPDLGGNTSSGTAANLDADAVLTVAPSDPSSVVEAEVDPFAPVVIDPAIPTATAAAGQTLIFNVPPEMQSTVVVSSDKPEVADVYSGSSDSTFSIDAGGDAIAPGTAVITITQPDGTTSMVTLTVTESP